MLITPQEAIAHARLDADYPPDQLLPYIAAADAAAVQFLQRGIFADEAELAAAQAQYPADVKAARAAYLAAFDAAQELEDDAERCAASDVAWYALNARLRQLRGNLQGIVITPDIKAAILLLFGHLFEQRSESAEKALESIPFGVHALLWPHRVSLGV